MKTVAMLSLLIAFAVASVADAGPIGRRIFARGMGKKPGHSVRNVCTGPNCSSSVVR